MWKGRFDDFMISSCKRVEPFASTTLCHLKKRFFRRFCGNKSLHKIFLPQPLKTRTYIRPPFTISTNQHTSLDPHPMLKDTLPFNPCQAATNPFLTPSSHCFGVTPLASNSQFSTLRCVTSISSTGCAASLRILVSLKNPARQSIASCGSDSVGRAGIVGAF